MPLDVEFEKIDECVRDVVHDLGGAIVVEEKLALAFEGAVAEFVLAGFEIEGELDVGAKEVGFDGLGIGPVEGLLKEEQTGDGIEFFGGPAEDGVEVRAELADGHELQEGGAEKGRPAVVKAFARQWGKDAVEGVEEGDLSGIDGMAHGGANSMRGMGLRYGTARVRQGEN